MVDVGSKVLSTEFNAVTAGDWTSYTPQWTTTGGGADPVLGNGSMIGKYISVGKLAVVKLRLTWGTTTTGGSGNWQWTLPPTLVPAVNNNTNLGCCLTLDAGASYKYDGAIIDNDTILRVIGIASGSFYTATVPMTWANTDFMALEIAYEVA